MLRSDMDSPKADIRRWAPAQELAARRILSEAARDRVTFVEALERFDDLRSVADAAGATADPERSQLENLAFHLTWARVRRAFGLG